MFVYFTILIIYDECLNIKYLKKGVIGLTNFILYQIYKNIFTNLNNV